MPSYTTRVNTQPLELYSPWYFILHPVHMLIYLDHLMVPTVSQFQPFAHILI